MTVVTVDVAVEVDVVVEMADVPDRPQTLARAVQTFTRQVRASKKKPAGMGQMERQLAQASKPLLREALREMLQAQADGCSPNCPICGGPLSDCRRRERTVQTQWGEVTLSRIYGYCARCGRWSAPADQALGLEEQSQSSPDLAEKMAYLGTKVPIGEAAEILEHLTGEKIAPSRVERQVRRTGKKALKERDDDVKAALSTEQRWEFARHHGRDLPELFTLIILLDAWMMRGRDDWGQSQSMRQRGQALKRWHETKTGRFYRIESEDWHEGSQPSLKGSTYVSTRGGPERFSELVWTEAVRQGLLQAKRVVVIADGGVWIWKIVEDRFSFAEGTLDFYHAAQHLWVVANAVHGEGTKEARAWVEPLLHQLRRGGEYGVIQTLKDLIGLNQGLTSRIVEREAQYFESHREHLAYQAKAGRGEPVGSGAIESACKQYQCRFKRSGQFWSTTWDEGLLELKSRQLSHRWNQLWPHLHQQI